MIMKRVLLFLLILSVGCDKNRDSKTTNKVDNDLRITIADQLDGYWLSDSYLVDVDSSRSIYDSKNYQTKFWGFRLEKENLMSDSATINGFTEHEGGYGGSIEFDSIKKTFVNYIGNADESSFLNEPFELRLIDSTHLELDFGKKKDRYRKISDEQIELRRLLFEGKFKDLMHNNQVIEFSRDGLIRGLDKQKYFELVFDFGEGINYDVSVFYPDKDSSGLWTNGDLFHFKITTDTLKLYRITPDWDEMNHTIGDLEYLLVKS
jgi:hypothetical protein